MKTLYRNRGGDSGITYYEIFPDKIAVWFASGMRVEPYEYSYSSAGMKHVEEMKRLALQGMGLNEYINKHAKNLYIK